MKSIFTICCFLFIISSCQIENPQDQESTYFPSNNNESWETITFSDANFNEENTLDLYNFLEEKNTKGFIILKNGKIVIEKYFNGHNATKRWIWYSAAKTLTGTCIGIAQQEGFIDIKNKTADYLGHSWSSLPKNKENLIKVKHHLTMTTGLKSNIDNFLSWSCTLPACLEYNADPNTIWNYHQGAYTLLQKMITQNTGTTFENYFDQKIKIKIGMDGNWDKVLYLNLYKSTTRSMARFGLLILNKGKWKEETIIPSSYFNEMTNTSQSLNKSYGYLWWLNGKESFINTSSEFHNSSIIPNAPSDMFAALGANDQKIYIVPSDNLVVIRCGNSAGNEGFALSGFDNQLWKKINAVINN